MAKMRVGTREFKAPPPVDRAAQWLVEQASRLSTLFWRVLREPHQTTITRLEADKDREDAKTVDLRAILEAKTALTESKETNAQLKRDIAAVGGKPAKVEPEAAPVVRSRRA